MNVAFPVAADADALKQAKILVRRMKKLQGLNVTESWKMVTVFFGANDLCSAQCFDKEKSSPRRHAKKLMAALDYLYENLTRTFVNLIPVLGNLYCSIYLQFNPMSVKKLEKFLAQSNTSKRKRFKKK